MLHRVRSDQPALITTAPESSEEEFDRRHKRYAIMAAIFVASFTAGALTYRDTVLALLLCGVAMITLVSAVIAANTRSRPRRPNSLARLIDSARQLPPAPTEHRTVGH
jgi:hypothetical protein